MPELTHQELEAFLDEALPPEQMARVEQELRDDAELSARLAEIIGRRDAGVHTIGAIWRRHRLTCPSRDQLGSFLLDGLPREHTEYIRFHIETVGCRLCLANLEDLRAQQAESEEESVTSRRRRYFQSSAGYLDPRGS